MSIFDFADHHPWWTLIYLAMIAGALHGLVRVKIVKRPKSEGEK